MLFDFQLPRVMSINFSGHKYGLVYPGIAFVVFRSAGWIPDMRFTVDYLGATETHFGLNFSRPGAYVAAQYYQFVRLGKEGYRRIYANLMHIYDFVVEKLQETGRNSGSASSCCGPASALGLTWSWLKTWWTACAACWPGWMSMQGGAASLQVTSAKLLAARTAASRSSTPSAERRSLLCM